MSMHGLWYWLLECHFNGHFFRGLIESYSKALHNISALWPSLGVWPPKDHKISKKKGIRIQQDKNHEGRSSFKEFSNNTNTSMDDYCILLFIIWCNSYYAQAHNYHLPNNLIDHAGCHDYIHCNIHCTNHLQCITNCLMIYFIN